MSVLPNDESPRAEAMPADATRDASPAVERLSRLLAETVRRGASDLVLVADAPPTVFLFGRWVSIADEPMSAEDVAACVRPLLTAEERDRLETVRDLDLGRSLPQIGRIRVNVHYQRGALALAARLIPESVPPFESLGLPPQVLKFCDYPSGLVLVTGGTGQGKSTTLAAMIDYMNQKRSSHVITIEDPVEFGFTHGTCLIEQRQVGDDTPSFASALRHVLRQRPDVILIGEMRDLETIQTALTAAETGHLVLTTLHTASAAQTIARIIDVFPSAQQAHVRTQLAASLRAILCQMLFRDQSNEALVPATELLIATSAIRRAIRDNETHLVYAMLETGRRHGMHTLEQSLEALVRSGRITAGAALSASVDSVRMRSMVGNAETEAVGDGMEAIVEELDPTTALGRRESNVPEHAAGFTPS
ncbi:MAG: type IV pilus twitching motility protein PilT [Phycisphaerae bacterium]